jgi:hypothetical protein
MSNREKRSERNGRLHSPMRFETSIPLHCLNASSVYMSLCMYKDRARKILLLELDQLFRAVFIIRNIFVYFHGNL